MGDNKGRMKEAFCLFDRDADGLLNSREFAVALRALGANPSEKEIDDMLGQKVEITFDEFAKLVQDKVKPKETMVKDLTVAFKTFDRENNGTISTSELKQVLVNLGEKLQAPDIERLIKEADPTSSGSIDYAKFSQILVG